MGEVWEEVVCTRRLTTRYSKAKVGEVAASTRRHRLAVDMIPLDRVWAVLLEAQEWVDGPRILSVDSVAATLYDRLSTYLLVLEDDWIQDCMQIVDGKCI